jgi:hypothetical protein
MMLMGTFFSKRVANYRFGARSCFPGVDEATGFGLAITPALFP